MTVTPLADDERAWLKELHAELWPEQAKKKGPVIAIDALRPLTTLEFTRLSDLITTRGLVTSMFSSNMFGGYGMDVYEHEPFPGTGPVFLLRLVEDNHPDPHPLQISEEGYKKHIRRGGGVGRDDAWESFSRFTHSKQNREWLTQYRMESPFDRGHYDY